jgi:hypothetical protein
MPALTPAGPFWRTVLKFGNFFSPAAMLIGIVGMIGNDI